MLIQGLYVILENAAPAKDILEGGCRILQLRNKTATTLQLFEESEKMVNLTKRYNAIFIVNDRVDIALAVNADGVHLGKEDLPLTIARKLLPDKIIGFSADNIEEALKAQKEGADYVSLGPIFPTQTKPDAGPVVGLAMLSELKSKLSIPLVAIGGINKYNLTQVVKSGADAIAVISAVSSSSSPREAVEDLILLFKKAREEME